MSERSEAKRASYEEDENTSPPPLLNLLYSTRFVLLARCSFAYGQTGTGKTYTMEGFSVGAGGNDLSNDVEERGIIPRAIEQIFGHIQSYASPTMRFLVRASYLQIYNEQVSECGERSEASQQHTPHY